LLLLLSFIIVYYFYGIIQVQKEARVRSHFASVGQEKVEKFFFFLQKKKLIKLFKSFADEKKLGADSIKSARRTWVGIQKLVTHFFTTSV
jgi:hypothetical protein